MYISQHCRVILTLVISLSSNCIDFTRSADEGIEEFPDGNPEAPFGFCDRTDTDGCTSRESENTLPDIDGVSVGHIRQIYLKDGRSLTVHTASIKPQVMEIPGFLSKEECSHLVRLAKRQGLRSSGTVSDHESTQIHLMDVDHDSRLSLSEMMLTLEDYFDMYLDEADILDMYDALEMDTNKDQYITPDEIQKTSVAEFSRYLSQLGRENPIKRSRFSEQIWLFPDTSKDMTFRDIQSRVQEVTRLPMIMIKKSDFQVVHYGVGGHYNAHQDSSSVNEDPCCTRDDPPDTKCRICRLMTVLFYLNDVTEGGGTAFPLAGNDTYDENKLRQSHHINLQRHCHDAPLVVKPQLGKAVFWYNHELDKTTGWVGDLDEFTWHGGCPVVRGEKWIANFWIKFTTDKEKYLRDEHV